MGFHQALDRSALLLILITLNASAVSPVEQASSSDSQLTVDRPFDVAPSSAHRIVTGKLMQESLKVELLSVLGTQTPERGAVAGELEFATTTDNSGWEVVSTVRLPQSFFDYSPQGVATLPDGSFVFSGKTMLRRTKDKPPFHTVQINSHPIPQNLMDMGYHHIGDIAFFADHASGDEYILAPVEDLKYKQPRMFVYNLSTLEYLWSHPLNQSHASFIAVDPTSLLVYSSEFENVTEIKRSHFVTGVEAPPLRLQQNGIPIRLKQVQGCYFLSSADELYVTANQGLNTLGDVFVFEASTGQLKYSFDVTLSWGVAEMEGVALVDPLALEPRHSSDHPIKGHDYRAEDKRLRMYVVANVINIWATVTILEFTLPRGAT